MRRYQPKIVKTNMYFLFQRFLQTVPKLMSAKYSVYPPHFREPVYKKEELDKLCESKAIDNYKLIPFKAVASNHTCSVFHDPMIA